MPTYVWKCPQCAACRDVISTMLDRNVHQICECMSPMVRVITTPMVRPDIAPYTAMTGDKAGKSISGRKAHREFLKRNRLVEVGNAPVQDTRQFRKVHKPRELAPAIKDAIDQVCVPDFEHGGLKERHGR